MSFWGVTTKAFTLVEFTSLWNHERITVNDQEKLKIEDYKTKCGLFFYSFSPVNNIKKLFTINKSGDQSLTVLNGIRVISMCWVIIGHSFNFILLVPTVNSANLPLMFNSILFGIVPAGVYAVDIFFFLSGLLTCYLLILKMYPKKGSINFLLVYFHRYYRLIFPLLFVQGLSMCLIRYLGDGPIYRQSWDSLLKKQWEKYWWSHLFFINNLIPWKTSDEWIVWAWYLANDFEFFLITPPILYLFCKSRISGYIAIYVLLIATMLSNAIIYGYYNISPAGKSEEIDFQNFIYIKPWVRIGPYLIGILFGLGVFELKMKEKYHELKDTLFNSFFEKLCNSRTLSASSAVIGTLFMILCCLPIGYVYAKWLQTNCLSRLSSALFGMWSRSLFVIGLGLIIAPTIVGRLRFLIYFLGSETCAVLARLNYVVYLMHVGMFNNIKGFLFL